MLIRVVNFLRANVMGHTNTEVACLHEPGPRWSSPGCMQDSLFSVWFLTIWMSTVTAFPKCLGLRCLLIECQEQNTKHRQGLFDPCPIYPKLIKKNRPKRLPMQEPDQTGTLNDVTQCDKYRETRFLCGAIQLAKDRGQLPRIPVRLKICNKQKRHPYLLTQLFSQVQLMTIYINLNSVTCVMYTQCPLKAIHGRQLQQPRMLLSG